MELDEPEIEKVFHGMSEAAEKKFAHGRPIVGCQEISTGYEGIVGLGNEWNSRYGKFRKEGFGVAFKIGGTVRESREQPGI